MAKPCSLYFVQVDQFVKIGVANDFGRRLVQLENGCPFPVRVLAVVAGSRHLERQLHAKFHAIRHRAEWFVATPDLLQWIDRNTKNGVAIGPWAI